MQILGWVAAIAVSLVVMTGCSSASESSTTVPESTETTSPAEGSQDEIDAGSANTSEPAATAAITIDDESGSDVAPLEAYDETEPTPDDEGSDESIDSAYISRRSMSSTAIELGWSEIDGATEYEVHRLARSSDTRPPASALSNESIVHLAGDRGEFIDNSVTPNTTYWYGIRGLDSDGNVLAVGWHRAAAVDDDVPPDQVDIVADVQGGTVLLSWSEPAENYELHAYRILRSVNGGELESLATTWDLDQTSFLDDDPPSGVVTYAVEAMDFHWNKSELSLIDVDLS